MNGGKIIRIVSFTTLFPNCVERLHGLFIKYRLAEISRGCELQVVAPVNVVNHPRWVWQIPRQEKIDGIPVFHPRFGLFPGILKHWDGEWLFRQTLPQIRNHLAFDQIDLVDVHYAYPDGWAGYRLARTIGRPFVLSLRGSDLNVLAQFPLRRRRIVEVLRQADAIIAVSESLKRSAEALGADPKKIDVIPNGVDPERFHLINQAEARHKLGWGTEERVILFVGRLVPIKGLDLLIDAVEILHNRGVKVKCLIVGEGEMRGDLLREIIKKRLQEVVLLVGATSPAELGWWYSASDLVCLFSRNEGCPNVVLEALACGTPVIATAVGGLPDLIIERKNGFLIQDRNPEVAANCIAEGFRQNWDHAGIAEEMASRDWGAVARKQIDVFRKVLEH